MKGWIMFTLLLVTHIYIQTYLLAELLLRRIINRMWDLTDFTLPYARWFYLSNMKGGLGVSGMTAALRSVWGKANKNTRICIGILIKDLRR